ncbi:DUF4440 domain-containing protein [uncultured Pontibacter sp.]|uniref:YybH family protein n=1 Tax=uncultured Pontibacter sp. TaxID=453356 RepID=UPI002601CF3B|nr:DUF4440 domain-containing protein [uncultured Pontibacter sp.]
MKNKLYFLLAVSMLGLSACSSTQTTVSTTNTNAEVRQVLEEQAQCWSAGDLECYMQGYWRSDSLLFIGSRGLTYGWQQTLDNYKRSYPDASAMGKLNFDLKELRQLSPETMLVVGKWHLQRDAAKGDLEGHFSVIFRRFADGWKIIADHSS